MPTRHPVQPLTEFTTALFTAAGMEFDKAASVARLLVPTDMLGRPTQGVALSPLYLDQLDKGLMAAGGEPECLNDTGATVVWDGRYLPGLWLVERALQTYAVGEGRLVDTGRRIAVAGGPASIRSMPR